MQGWTKLHRKLLNNPIFNKPELLQLFIYCLLRANHDESKIIFNGKEETLEKGSFITGRKVIARDTGQGESAIYKRLHVLQNLNIITLKSNNRFTVIKVCNYCIYQGQDNEKEQLGNNKVTTKEQLGNTDKNVKNVKNVKKKDISVFEVAITDFKEFRKGIKSPMTDRAIELLIINLEKLAPGDDDTKVKILEQSIMNGWKSVYALKDDNPKQQGFSGNRITGNLDYLNDVDLGD